MVTFTEDEKITVDYKSVAAFGFFLVSIAASFFTTQGHITSLEVEQDRMKEHVELNTEFRIGWPRGEFGSLPDDARQNIRLDYIEKYIEELRAENKELRNKIIELEHKP